VTHGGSFVSTPWLSDFFLFCRKWAAISPRWPHLMPLAGLAASLSENTTG